MRTIDLARLMEQSPTRIAISTGGVHIYEHPTQGDEAPLIGVLAGRAWITDSYEPEDAAADVLGAV